MRRWAVLLALALTPSAARANDQLAPERGARVEVHELDGVAALTIEARDVPARALVETIAGKLGLELVAFEAAGRDPLVSAYLRRQPRDDALRWVLGSVGLRAEIGPRGLRVLEDVSPYPQSRDLLLEAERRYAKALRDYPDWPSADRAQMARARIDEGLGPEHLGAAALGYDAVIEGYPESELVPEAMLRSARLAGRAGKWQQAALRFEELAALPSRHPYHAEARLGLARALCRSGERSDDAARLEALGTKALYYLDALDNHYPTETSGERRERFLARSRAYSLAGDAVRALKALDTAARYSVAGEQDPEVLELRARALEQSGDHASASTAWLAYAEELLGEEREQAYVEAARTALAAGHEIAVLAIARAAEAEGFGERLAGHANLAHMRLGLPGDELDAFDARQHLLRGEGLLERRMFEQAARALRLAHAERQDLTAGELLRLALAYARALDRTGSRDGAIDVLRRLAGELPSPEQRAEVYRLAAELYEDRLLYDRAIEALRGRL